MCSGKIENSEGDLWWKIIGPMDQRTTKCGCKRVVNPHYHNYQRGGCIP